MVRREKLTMFLDCKESTTVFEVKRMIEGITKKSPEDQRLYKDDQILEDNRTLGDYGFTSSNAKAHLPATIGMTYKLDDGEWEPLMIAPLSNPPELPEVMKPDITSGNGTS